MNQEKDVYDKNTNNHNNQQKEDNMKKTSIETVPQSKKIKRIKLANKKVEPVVIKHIFLSIISVLVITIVGIMCGIQLLNTTNDPRFINIFDDVANEDNNKNEDDNSTQNNTNIDKNEENKKEESKENENQKPENNENQKPEDSENKKPENNENQDNKEEQPKDEEKEEEKIPPPKDDIYTKLNELMKKYNYNEYAIKVINSFIPDYQKLFTDDEIYNLFTKVTKITLNPYDPSRPNLSHTNRAVNSNGNITVNCFENELENDANWEGLKWLLTHEIMHSLGQFPHTNTNGSFNLSATVRNRLLEEGLADSIAHNVKKTAHNNKFAIAKQEKFIMYNVDSNYKVNTSSNVNHTYTISGNIISLFKYIGCYDEIIDANINSSFNEVKSCMSKNVQNGSVYFESLFDIINKIYLYTKYPNTFITSQQLINNTKALYPNHQELFDFANNNNLNDVLINYAKLSADIINNKTNNEYSICDFYRNNVIFYSEDGTNFQTDIKCNNP